VLDIALMLTNYCYIQWLKWDLSGGGTLIFCIGATEKNDSPWDNLLSIVV